MEKLQGLTPSSIIVDELISQKKEETKIVASESYIVSIDVEEGADYVTAALTVAKYDGSRLEMLATHTGMDAINVYDVLMNGIKNIERGNTNEQNGSIETERR